MSIMKKIRSKVDKARKKYIPTFGEQHSKAKAEGKKTFRSTRDDTKKGNLEKEVVLEIRVNNFLTKVLLLN